MKQIRNREKKTTVKLTLLKLFPWIFLILLYIALSSLGTAIADGPYGAIID